MIRRFVYGKVLPTDAVVKSLDICTESLPYFKEEKPGCFSLPLEEGDVVYGLGEQIRGINKRGWKYVSWNLDTPHHHEDSHSLYASHNFLLIKGKETWGVFFDYPGKMVYDIGYSQRGQLLIEAASPDMDVYLIEGTNEKDIVKQFRQLVGRNYIPPFWAFGYGQSRWGYKNEGDIRTVAESYQKAGIPLDSIYMDIDYMEDFKDFTVNQERFPDLKGLAGEMKEQGIHLVPIIDAGVKVEKGYDVYEEGVAAGYFCKNADGTDFQGHVWPGRVHFPDFLNPKAREWFGNKYERLTSLGIDGFWNDMNEPANFYTETRLIKALKKLEELGKPEELEAEDRMNEAFDLLTDTINGLANSEEDYASFYHQLDGQMVNHREVHNLFGMNMTRSAYEALARLNPDKRVLFFSRSSCAGAHRYGGIWQGDNKSWWSHILLSMQQLVGLNMAGFLYTGPDTGGFGCDATEDLMLRWIQYTIFTPLFRNHSCDGTRYQELYQFSTVEAMGKMIKIRYALIPYLYSEFLKASLKDEMLFRPLGFDFPDDSMAVHTEDQLFLGNEVMIAPVYQQNTIGRSVYLPEEMMMIRMKSYDQYESKVLKAGHHYVEVGLEDVVFFIRKGKKIPLCQPADNTRDLDYSSLQMLGYPEASYELYKDDGVSPDPEQTLEIKCY